MASIQRAIEAVPVSTKNDRLHIQDISPGMELSEETAFSRDQIQACCMAVGERNPIHHDAEAARRIRLPDIVVPGFMINGAVSGMISRRFAEGTLDLDSHFVRRKGFICADDRIRLHFKVAAVTGKEVSCEVRVVKTDSDTEAATGTCVIRVPRR